MKGKRVLEINPRHPIIKELRELIVKDPEIKRAESYADIMQHARISVDVEQHKRTILESSNALAESVNGCIVVHSDLLDEVANLVEAPVPVLGMFKEAFLSNRLYVCMYLFGDLWFRHQQIPHFVRDFLNPEYFGKNTASVIPELVGTVESPSIPFSSISVLKKHGDKDMTYKVFSREPMADALLDQIFSARKEMIRINWAAYPHYEAPERFAPLILDGKHLYYINAFENAASTMETSAVAAENVARLILSQLSLEGKLLPTQLISPTLKSDASDIHGSHPDL